MFIFSSKYFINQINLSASYVGKKEVWIVVVCRPCQSCMSCPSLSWTTFGRATRGPCSSSPWGRSSTVVYQACRNSWSVSSSSSSRSLMKEDLLLLLLLSPTTFWQESSTIFFQSVTTSLLRVSSFFSFSEQRAVWGWGKSENDSLLSKRPRDFLLPPCFYFHIHEQTRCKQW